MDKALDKAKIKNVAEFRRLLKRKVASTCSPDAEIEMIERMKRIKIPLLDFKPTETLSEAIGYFYRQSVEHDDPTLPASKRGITLVLKAGDDESLAKKPIPPIAASKISVDARNAS